MGGDVLEGLERRLVFNRLRSAIGLRFELPLLLEGLALPAGARTLELGAGLGWGSAGLVRRLRPALAVVTDYDAAVLPGAGAALAGTRYSRVTLARVDAKQLPFPDATFDLVLMLYALHHVMGYEPALREAARVLKDGGLFLFAEPLRAWSFLRLRRHAPPDGLASPHEMRALLRAAGFAVERWRGVPFWAYVVARRVA